MIASFPPDDRLYIVTYAINVINDGKPVTIAAMRQGAVGIARKLSTDPLFTDKARIIEIVSADGSDRRSLAIRDQQRWSRRACRPRRHCVRLTLKTIRAAKNWVARNLSGLLDILAVGCSARLWAELRRELGSKKAAGGPAAPNIR
jgi:hypothetical protein